MRPSCGTAETRRTQNPTRLYLIRYNSGYFRTPLVDPTPLAKLAVSSDGSRLPARKIARCADQCEGGNDAERVTLKDEDDALPGAPSSLLLRCRYPKFPHQQEDVKAAHERDCFLMPDRKSTARSGAAPRLRLPSHVPAPDAE